MADLFGERDSSLEVTLVSQSSSPKKVAETADTTQKANLNQKFVARQEVKAPVRPKTIGIPAHRQRKENPQVKQLDLPSTNFASGSTLSTKNRVLQQSAAPPSKPAFVLRKPNLVGLSFKKNSEQKQPGGNFAQRSTAPIKKPIPVPAANKVLESPPTFPQDDVAIPDQMDTEPELFLPMDEDGPDEFVFSLIIGPLTNKFILA